MRVEGASGVEMSIAVVFPGQGAQAPGLGAPWRDHPAWHLVARAEEASGERLERLLLDAPADELGRTREAQLVVFLASLLAWEAAAPTLGEPVAMAGHSLGQITALVASGALPFDAGVRLAVRRATVTQEAADARPGTMAALLGGSLDQASQACAAAPDACWVANDNGPGQVVVGGTPEGVEAASQRARELGVRRVVPLNVAGAFHTRLMAPAVDSLTAHLATAPFSDSAVPVLTNTDAEAHTDGEGWRTRLAEHLVQPVRWHATMSALAALGITQLVEVGPGTTLTGMARRALPGVTLRNISTPADVPLPVEASF